MRFTHESRAAAAIDHPHIVPVFEAGESDGLLYIAMRYVEGTTCASPRPARPAARPTRCASPRRSPPRSTPPTSTGLVHRDVKPGNILVERHSDHPEHVYLTDFGLTKKSLSLSSLRPASSSAPSTTSRPSRSPAADGRCDVYRRLRRARVLAGRPLSRDDDMALLWAHQYDEPPR